MARRPALQDAGAARPEHQRAPAAHPGRAQDPHHRGVAGAAGSRGRALRAGADPRAGHRPSAGAGQQHPAWRASIPWSAACARRAPAARFAKTPPELRRGAPLHGEHTGEVLAELGLSRHDIDALRAARHHRRREERGADGRRAPPRPGRRAQPRADPGCSAAPSAGARAGAGNRQRLGRARRRTSRRPSPTSPSSRATPTRRRAPASMPGPRQPACPTSVRRSRSMPRPQAWPIDCSRCRAVHQHDPHLALGSRRRPRARAPRVLPPGGLLYLYGPFAATAATRRPATTPSTAACARRTRSGACATWKPSPALAADARLRPAGRRADARQQSLADLQVSWCSAPARRPVRTGGLPRAMTA